MNFCKMLQVNLWLLWLLKNLKTALMATGFSINGCLHKPVWQEKWTGLTSQEIRAVVTSNAKCDLAEALFLLLDQQITKGGSAHRVKLWSSNTVSSSFITSKCLVFHHSWYQQETKQLSWWFYCCHPKHSEAVWWEQNHDMAPTLSSFPWTNQPELR